MIISLGLVFRVAKNNTWYVPVILWFIIRHIYLVFICGFGTELLKPLEFSKWDDKIVFCYVNEVALVPPLKDGAWLPGEPTLCLEGGNFQSHPLISGEGRGRVRDWIIAYGQWFISHAYVMKPLLKPKRTGFGELLGWWTRGDAGRVACLERAWKLCTPFPTPCPMHLFHLAVPNLHPFIINQ